MTFNSNKINLPKFVTIKFRDKFKIRCMMERAITLSHHAKTRIYLVHLGFQHSGNCIRQYRYFSRKDFYLKGHCNFDLHYFHCALPKDKVDMEMTIWMVDGIHTYRRDQTTQVTFYSPWSRQVKPFSSLRKKIAEYREEKMESHKKRNSNPLTPVQENNFAKKRSRRPQESRKY